MIWLTRNPHWLGPPPAGARLSSGSVDILHAPPCRVPPGPSSTNLVDHAGAVDGPSPDPAGVHDGVPSLAATVRRNGRADHDGEMTHYQSAEPGGYNAPPPATGDPAMPGGMCWGKKRWTRESTAWSGAVPAERHLPGEPSPVPWSLRLPRGARALRARSTGTRGRARPACPRRHGVAADRGRRRQTTRPATPPARAAAAEAPSPGSGGAALASPGARTSTRLPPQPGRATKGTRYRLGGQGQAALPH